MEIHGCLETVRVTPVYGDTLTWGGIEWKSMVGPGTVRVTPVYWDTLT